MGHMERPPFINPAYEFGAPNQSTLVSKETVVIQVDGDSYSGQGEVRLDLLPRAGVQSPQRRRPGRYSGESAVASMISGWLQTARTVTFWTDFGVFYRSFDERIV
jgi:hypothetical protein